MQLIDIGANLTHDSFDKDRQEVIDRAQQAGVVGMVLTGSSVSGSQDAFELAQQFDGYFRSTAGIHPHHAKDFDESALAQFENLLQHPTVVAVGECGLDYFRNFSTPQQQQHAFEEQLRLATRTQKPLFLHQRDAHEDFSNLVAQYRDQVSGGVAHCFTGQQQELEAYLDLDLHIGITGWICDERRGHHLKDLVKYIPANRLMIETDAPYLLPRDLKPKPKSRRNEPHYLSHVARVVAAAAGITPEQLAEQTTATAQAFFGHDFR